MANVTEIIRNEELGIVLHRTDKAAPDGEDAYHITVDGGIEVYGQLEKLLAMIADGEETLPTLPVHRA